MALDAVDCVLLGQPKSSPLPDPTLARVPGALVNLLYEGVQRDCLLAAHIEADRWFCHGGGSEEDPFNANGLCVQDIVMDASKKPMRRRSNKTCDMRTKAISNPESWSACVAYATWRGEVLRADGLNMASVVFEPSHFSGLRTGG